MASSAYLILALTLSVFAKFSSSQPANTTCTTVFDRNQDYFPFGYTNETFALPIEQVTIKTAEEFTVAYNKSFKVLQSNKNKEVYVLYQCATPKPEVNLLTVPPKYFEVPLSRVALDSTVAVTFLGFLGVTNRIRHADLSYAFSPCLHKLMEDGMIRNLNASSEQQLASLSAVITSVDKSDQQLKALPKFIDFGSATSDSGPLKRAEWIKYVATLFNKEAIATKVYDQIEANYNCQANVYTKAALKPVVVWMSYYGGVWQLESAKFKLQYVTDAGGVNLDTTLLTHYNMSVDTEVANFQRALKLVDVVFDNSYSTNGPAYNVTTLTEAAKISPAFVPDYKFLVNQRVWRADRLLGPAPTYNWAWFEAPVAEPHVVLSEIARAINPAVVATPLYFRNIAKGEQVVIQTSSDCPNAYLSPEPTVIPCPLEATAAAPPPKKNSAPATNVALASVVTLAAMAAALILS